MSRITVDSGCVSSRRAERPGFRVIDARFPANLHKPAHRHDWPTFGVILEGELEVAFGGVSRRCPPATVGGEPLGEDHWNRVGPEGVHIVAFEIDPARMLGLEPARGLLRDGRSLRHRAAGDLGRRAVRELGATDAAAPLLLESILFELLGLFVRSEGLDAAPRRPPAWLRGVQEAVHDRFLEPLSTEELAREAGVHAIHLARVFRAHLGSTIGEYQRGLRLDWAARRLTETDDPIVDVALAAGFADQSHFGRAFRDHYGWTPNQYRRSRRTSSEEEPRPVPPPVR